MLEKVSIFDFNKLGQKDLQDLQRTYVHDLHIYVVLGGTCQQSIITSVYTCTVCYFLPAYYH